MLQMVNEITITLKRKLALA